MAARSRAHSPSSAPFGSETPRLFTPPLRPLSDATSRGYECIRFAQEVLGLALHPWQRWLLIHLLELNPDGTFRFRNALILIARQNGKTTILGLLFLWRMYVDGAKLVVGTAQKLDLAEETWSSVVEMAQGNAELNAEIQDVVFTNGKKALILNGGQRYKVEAASRRAGRGLSVDFGGLDELREHTTWDCWSAISKTTMARPSGQITAWSNAGDSKSVVLNHLRARALEQTDPSLGLFEWSAQDDCDLDDHVSWAQANPSLGYSIQLSSIASARGTDPEAVFRTEVLCQRVDDLVPAVIPTDEWLARRDPESQLTGIPIFALDVSPNRDWSCITVAGYTDDGRAHIEITGTLDDAGAATLDYQPGTAWVPARLAELGQRWGNPKVVLTGKAAQALTPVLEAAGVEVHAIGGTEYSQACGSFFDAAVEGELVHIGQTELDDALRNARKKSQGDDGFTWNRRRPAGDITPLVSATAAHWGLVSGLAAAEVSVWSLSTVEA